MGYHKTSLVAFALVIGILLSAVTVCRHGVFSERVANSIDACVNAQSFDNIGLLGFWMNEQRLLALRTASSAIKKRGIIDSAVISTLNKEGHKSFDVGYLSDDADIKRIVISKGDEIILSVPPPTRKYAQIREKEYVSFEELLVWRTPDNPFTNAQTGDLSVTLVKDDGKIIGPARILSDTDVWEEIRAKILVEKQWQDKFPWLYVRLLKDPAMKPLWRDPDGIVDVSRQTDKTLLKKP